MPSIPRFRGGGQKKEKGGTASAKDEEMKRAPVLPPSGEPSKREKAERAALLKQVVDYQSDLAKAIAEGDALKKAEFSALIADVKLQIANDDLDDAPNDARAIEAQREAKERALVAQREVRALNEEAKREARQAQRQAEYDRRKAEHDQKVAVLERKIAEAKSELSSPVTLIAEHATKVFGAASADLDKLRWNEEDVRADIAKMFPMTSIFRGKPALPFGDNDIQLKVLPTHLLHYVDDGNEHVKVASSMENYIISIAENHLTNALVPIITGPPGCGKSRLAEEAAMHFVRRNPEQRHAARVTLEENDALSSLRSFVPLDKNAPSDILLAAALLSALFKDFKPELYEFEMKDVQRFILAKLPPGITTIALVIDEFSNDLKISERLFSSCISLTVAQSQLQVVPVFAGVHRTRVPSDMQNLLGMKQRTSGQMGTAVTLLTSLSKKEENQLVNEMASKWVIPYDDMMHPKALGCFISACGRSPSLLVLLYMTLTKEEHKIVLKEIIVNKAVGTKSGMVLWAALVSHLSVRFSLVKFAELISPSEKSFGTQAASKESQDLHRPNRLSLALATLVMQRLALLAMTGLSVDLSDEVLRSSDLSLLQLEPASSDINDLPDFTYQRARSMVEITPLEDDSTRGCVAMPMLVIATLCQSLTSMKLERDLLNPIITTPGLLEDLAIESLANVFKAHRHLGLESVSVDQLRPGNRRWGRDASLCVPQSCLVAQLADHLGVNAHLVEARTQSNGKGIPVKWQEGLFFISAVNQPAVDGGGIAKEEGTGLWTIIVSQSKSTLDYVPQTGEDGSVVTIGKSEAIKLLTGMRERASLIRTSLGLNSNDAVLCIYDLFTTRTLGQRFPRNDPDLFGLDSNEIVILTTKDTMPTALGPTLGLRVSLVPSES